MMILKDLRIQMNRYGENEGKYTGVANFSGDVGAVDLYLTPEHCEQIFLICADSILATAKEAATNLTTAVIEHKKQIWANHG